jgi:proline dehydrogenase
MTNYFHNHYAFEYKKQNELKRAIFVFWIFKCPVLSYVLQHMLRFALFLNLPIRWLMKRTVYGHFVGGESLSETVDVIHRLGNYGVGAIPDYSVESGDSAESISDAMSEISRSIEFAAKHENVPFAVFKPSGITYEWVLRQEKRDNLSQEIEIFRQRMFDLFDQAYHLDIPILVDAEEVAWQDIIDQIVEDGMRKFNSKRAIVFHTLQMYRKDRLEYLRKLYQDAEEKKYFIGIKLVRGAYLEKERERARKMGIPSPLHENKENTDNSYNEAIRFCVKHIDRISIFNGTHNVESSLLLTELMKENGLENKNKNVYFVQLYGMSDYLSFNLAKQGYSVAKYLPYGPVNKVMPYLMRRAEENSGVTTQVKDEYSLLVNELKRRKTKKDDDK